ncbi:hypothetical protein KAR91_45730 [Candidatus Pacearchaeota archaeon]|nr:hypothetical protein [Candidatus Pacearchaeota archaeon]
MKKTTIKASLMLEDTLKSPLIQDDLEVTSKDFKKGIDHICEMAAVKFKGRLTVIIDEQKLKEVFG